jgi:hypothetical protein
MHEKKVRTGPVSESAEISSHVLNHGGAFQSLQSNKRSFEIECILDGADFVSEGLLPNLVRWDVVTHILAHTWHGNWSVQC